MATMPRLTPDERAAAYIAWINRTGMVPSAVTPDEEERRLHGIYLYLRRKDRNPAEAAAFASMQAARTETYNRRRAEGARRRGFKPKGLMSARRIRAFYDRHGRLPLNRNVNERDLYGVLRNLRHQRKVGELSHEALTVLESIPGATTVVRLPPLPELEKLEAWCAEHRRLPRMDIPRGTTEADKLEVHLGCWSYRHVNRRHNPRETAETRMIRGRILALREKYPPHSAVKASAEAREVLEFIESSGRLPNWRRDSLMYLKASWIKGTFSGKPGHYGPDIAACVSALEGLPKAAESRWDGWFEDLRKFIGKEGRLPEFEYTGGLEKKLAQWLETADEIQDAGRVQRLNEVLGQFGIPRAA